MSSYAITGTSRGIGLSLVTLLAARPANEVRFIAAAARSKSPALQKLIELYPDRVIFVPLDVTRKESAETATRAVEQALGPDGGIDVLINNAGVMTFTPGGIQEM
jgi:NAD(P)-dependent dehydrogenase (short-subunit alcohol dehydrogenase family)